MPITSEPTPPETPECPNPTQDEIFMSDPQFRQSLSDFSQAVALENARKSTPIPEEDEMLRDELHRAATVKELASIVSSSYAARDVYELDKPFFIWNHLLEFLGPGGVNDLLMCVYLDGECSYFNPGDGRYLSRALKTWEDGKVFVSDGGVPDEHIVERMLSLFLGMANIVNRSLAQMYCTKSFWGQAHGGALFNMYQRAGLRSI
ncbi:hypothetical protein LCI18_004156 [Fusarium solani-melongenae]|uniref:Uncharacterized protein n=1 Tax=Fusarium solani subsp. cucurbitae TaxID=2747967 RepID=A0ACD3YWB9_FUSSC|nr:hypothetical protein LCI18_004156 [Fusarium solani-melongenae]